MEVFFSLFVNLLPLYALIALGYFCSKKMDVDRNSLATLGIYIFMPPVTFGYVANLDFQPEYIVLPIFYYAASVLIGLGFFAFGKRVYKDKQANLMAMCASMGNTGYFGIPLMMLFFKDNPDVIAIYIFMMSGGTIYEATVGYYIAARSSFTVKQSLIKLTRFPALYALAAGLAWNFSGLEFSDLAHTYWTHFKGCYVVIGMMILGGALARIDKLVFGWRFTALTFAGKFAVFPALALAYIWLDKTYFQMLGADIYTAIMMMAITPPAANIAAYASQMNMEPEKAATTILIGTVFALIYIPAVIWIIGL